jgi:hypothetical protein
MDTAFSAPFFPSNFEFASDFGFRCSDFYSQHDVHLDETDSFGNLSMCMQRVAWLAGFLAATLILVGCDGNKFAVVTGAAKFDGKPIEKGSINFYPFDGKTGTAGGEIKDGNYSVKVPVGLMKVQIGGVPKVVGMKEVKEGPGGKGGPKTVESIPAKFSDQHKTELRLEVKSGTNQKDWDLTAQ